MDEATEEFRAFNESDSVLMNKMREVWNARARTESVGLVAGIVATQLIHANKSTRQEMAKRSALSSKLLIQARQNQPEESLLP